MGSSSSSARVAPLGVIDCAAFLSSGCAGSCEARHNHTLKQLLQVTPALTPAPCRDLSCNGCALLHSPHATGPPPPHALTVLWDTENVRPVARAPGSPTAGDVALAALEVARVYSGGRCSAARVVAVHHSREALSLRSSLRTAGVEMLDAGTKAGAVDIALKGALNDEIVDHVVRATASGSGCTVKGSSIKSGVWIWVASSDRDFADDIRRARRVGMRVGIIYASNASADYVSLADAAVPWAAVLSTAAASSSMRSSGNTPPPIPIAQEHSGGDATLPLDGGAATSVMTPTAPLSPRLRICNHFLRGHCAAGVACLYAHSNACPYFAAGRCRRGEACRFSHSGGAASEGAARKRGDAELLLTLPTADAIVEGEAVVAVVESSLATEAAATAVPTLAPRKSNRSGAARARKRRAAAEAAAAGSAVAVTRV